MTEPFYPVAALGHPRARQIHCTAAWRSPQTRYVAKSLRDYQQWEKHRVRHRARISWRVENSRGYPAALTVDAFLRQSVQRVVVDWHCI
jgi:hypothetical protein